MSIQIFLPQENIRGCITSPEPKNCSKMLADAKDQFKSGKTLFGKDGAFHRVLEDSLNAALEGEMDSYLADRFQIL